MDPQKPTLDDLRIKRPDKPATNSRLWPATFGVLVLALVAAVVWWLMRPKAVEVRTALAREIAGGPAKSSKC
jgi:hypothetical protein